MSEYEIDEIAGHLYYGGWRAEDVEQFTQENAKYEPEAQLDAETITAIFREIARIQTESGNQGLT